MPTKTGVVDKVYDNKAVYIDGDRYSQYNPFKEPVAAGDTVAFDYTEKESRGRVYKNIVEKTFKVVSSRGGGSVPTGTVGTHGTRTPRDTSIERQNCLGHASRIHAFLIEQNIDIPGVCIEDKMVTDWDDLALSVVQLAERFQMYVQHGLPDDLKEAKGLTTGEVEDGSN